MIRIIIVRTLPSGTLTPLIDPLGSTAHPVPPIHQSPPMRKARINTLSFTLKTASYTAGISRFREEDNQSGPLVLHLKRCSDKKMALIAPAIFAVADPDHCAQELQAYFLDQGLEASIHLIEDEENQATAGTLFNAAIAELKDSCDYFVFQSLLLDSRNGRLPLGRGVAGLGRVLSHSRRGLLSNRGRCRILSLA